ncbi:MAG: hypothetical protein K2Z81_17590, partial [Cyanobacteria bacterium]|nr:hypothetical protein [Cyanobacteriota bacterium]
RLLRLCSSLIIAPALMAGWIASPAMSAETSEGKLHWENNSEVVQLTDLRDIGLCLIQIRNAATNIYLEATREEVPLDSQPKVNVPANLSDLKLDKETKYMKPRPDWMFFYIGTLEPILHLFGEDVKTSITEDNKVMVPKGTSEQFKRLFVEYENVVVQMNKHVSQIHELVTEEQNNIPLAREAVSLKNLAEELEKARVEAFELIRNADKSKGLECLDLNKVGAKAK